MRATHAYIGINEAGECRAIVCDDPGCEKKDTARMVGEWIRDGRKVERLPIDEAKARFIKKI